AACCCALSWFFCALDAKAIVTIQALRQNEPTAGNKTVLAEDQEIITRFLRHESEAAHVIEGWIARAASPFRQRLGLQWEDVLQEVSLEVTRLLERGSFRGESSLKTYLWRIVNHACINQLRQLRKLRTQAQTHWMEFEDLVELAVSPDGSPLDQLLQ